MTKRAGDVAMVATPSLSPTQQPYSAQPLPTRRGPFPLTPRDAAQAGAGQDEPETIAAARLAGALAPIAAMLARVVPTGACRIYVREADRLRLCAAAPAGPPGPYAAPWPADGSSGLAQLLIGSYEQDVHALVVAGRDDDPLGAVVLGSSTQLGDSERSFLADAVPLVANAIEAARLHDQAEARGLAASRLAELSRGIRAATDPGELLADVAAGLQALLVAEQVRVYTGLTGTGRARLATVFPPAASAAPDAAGAVLLDLLARGAGDLVVSAATCTALNLATGTTHAPAAAIAFDGEELGLLLATFRDTPSAEAAQLLDAVGSQLGVALEKLDLAGRVSAERAVDDLFAALASGRVQEGRERAARLRVVLDEPFAVVHGVASGHAAQHALPAVLAERIASVLRKIVPAVVCGVRNGKLEALMSLPRGGDEHGLSSIDDALAQLGGELSVALGRSELHRGGLEAAGALREAAAAADVARALRPEGGMLPYRELGVYRYLVRSTDEEALPDPYLDAIREVAAYDARRGSQLVLTLERYLATRGSIAETARLLTVHPNTLRQRLERIETLTGVDLTRADLLGLELAVKLARLRAVAPGDGGERRAA